MPDLVPMGGWAPRGA